MPYITPPYDLFDCRHIDYYASYAIIYIHYYAYFDNIISDITLYYFISDIDDWYDITLLLLLITLKDTLMKISHYTQYMSAITAIFYFIEMT